MEEVWRPIIGYEGIYEVSRAGFVRRILKTGRAVPLKPKMTRDFGTGGYVSWQLWKDKKVRFRLAHRLLWEAFVGPIPKGLQINHLNGVKTDNRLDNLEIVTPSQNSLHKFRVLGHAAPNNPSFGTNNGSAKLNDENVREIRRLYATTVPNQHRLAAMFGVCQRTINLIVRRKTWGHVS